MGIMWPTHVKCAIMISFDVDGETLWLGRDSQNALRPGVLSQGRYEAQLGIPLILDLLERHNVLATFFVPGWMADHHGDVIATIRAAGHEVGHHGYLHEWIEPALENSVRVVQEREVLSRGLKALARLGIIPVGYRAPGNWELTDTMLQLLTQNGFKYSSNMMDTIFPYIHAGQGSSRIVELPVHWFLDDVPFGLTSALQPRPISSPSALLEMWQWELDGMVQLGGLMTVAMHPQVTGRPSRLLVLDRFLAYAKELPVWFATGSEIADYALTHLTGGKA